MARESSDSGGGWGADELGELDDQNKPEIRDGLDLVVNIVVQIAGVERSSRRWSEHERCSSAYSASVGTDVGIVLIEKWIGLSQAVLLDVLIALVDLRPPQAVSKVIVDRAAVERRVRWRIVALRLTRAQFALLTAVINEAARWKEERRVSDRWTACTVFERFYCKNVANQTILAHDTHSRCWSPQT